MFHKLPIIVGLFILLQSVWSGAPVFAAPDAVKTFTVNSVSDEIDDLAGDGKCLSTPSQKCTLRAAIMEASALGGTVTIILPPKNDYLIQRAGTDDSGQSGDFDIMSNVNLTILGGDTDTTVIDGNQLDRIFDINTGAHVTLKYLTLQNGQSAQSGGAIYSGNAVVTLDRVILRNNQTNVDGGAIYAGGGMTLRDTMVRGNHADNNGDGGGMVNIGSDPTLLFNVSFFENTASDRGGGLYNAGSLTAVNTTVSSNIAKGNGGGIFNNGTLTLANATLSENITDADNTNNGDGGGAYNETGKSFTIRNSILAGNQDLSSAQSGLARPYNCKGTFTSQGYNLISINTGCVGFTNNTNGDKIGGAIFPINAKLYPFSTSGLRGTYSLQADSPARDAGNPDGCLDQNNQVLSYDTEYFARPADACDMGASEYGAVCAPPLTPETFTPINNAKLQTTKVTLQWQNNVNCFGKFKVAVKQDSTQGATVSSAKNLDAFQFTTKALTKGKNYFWRVTYCTEAGCANSAWNKFSIK